MSPGGLSSSSLSREQMMRSWFSLLPCSFLCTALLLPSHARAPGAAGRPPDWTVQVNYPAVNLALQAPYNTVQLAATARTRTPLLEASRPVFRASDSCVTVDATGLVTARTPTKGYFDKQGSMFWKTTTYVVVAVTAEGVTLTDTAWIQVTPTPWPHAIKTFSMHPAPGDSAKSGRCGFCTVTGWWALVTDVAGDTLCHHHDDKCPLLIQYTPYVKDGLNNNEKTYAAAFNRHPGDNLEWSGLRNQYKLTTDTVTLFARTLAYGVALQDSVVFRVGLPMVDLVVLVDSQTQAGGRTARFAASYRDSTQKTAPIILGVGGALFFINWTQAPYDVVFDHPEAVDTASCAWLDPHTGKLDNFRPWGSAVPTGRGNIPVIHHGCAARRFRKPGVYRFHSTVVPSDTVEVDVRAE